MHVSSVLWLTFFPLFLPFACSSGAEKPTPRSAAGGSSTVAGTAGAVTTSGGAAGSSGASSAGSGHAASAGSGTGGSGTGGSGAGGSGTGGSGGAPVIAPGSYALGPPDQCKNQFYVPGCTPGDTSTACGGVCTSVNACQNEGKTGAPGFICPRFMLFADEMQQASVDDAARYGWSTDGTSPFGYAVVGHDNDTTPGSVDDVDKQSPCCQCYQLVFDLPEDQALDQKTRAPAVPIPKPLIVQTFNTGATTKTFDIFMGSGGLGAMNACFGSASAVASQYTAYPAAGQPSGGGIKAAGEFGNGTACKDQTNLVTTQTLSSSACASLVESTCNQIEASSASITAITRRSCIDSNNPDSLYHMNWKVYAKRVACPASLTQVTGCKLQEALPAVDPKIISNQQAQADASFKSGYSTTTMQDCCKPSCAWQDKVTGSGGGHIADGKYNSFYTCSQDGKPLVQP